jgi:hypothetical protein
VKYLRDRGPRCDELVTAAAVRAEANDIYDKHFAPGDAIKGGPEDNPRTLARYRESATREIRPIIRATCARHSPSFRPRRTVVRAYDSD